MHVVDYVLIIPNLISVISGYFSKERSNKRCFIIMDLTLCSKCAFHPGSVMDGMTEACMKGGIEACYSSVSCACALLGALDELSQGRGIQPEQVGSES